MFEITRQCFTLVLIAILGGCAQLQQRAPVCSDDYHSVNPAFRYTGKAPAHAITIKRGAINE